MGSCEMQPRPVARRGQMETPPISLYLSLPLLIVSRDPPCARAHCSRTLHGTQNVGERRSASKAAGGTNSPSVIDAGCYLEADRYISVFLPLDRESSLRWREPL